MAKSRYARDDMHMPVSTRYQSPSLSLGMMLGAVLAGMALLLVFTFLTWDRARQTQTVLDAQLADIQNRLTQLATKVDQVSTRAAAPAQRGPDPSRVYAIRTDGAPFKGPRDAPITIAEFSDFQ